MDMVQATKSVVSSLTATSAQTASSTIDVVGFDAISVDVLYRPTAAGAPSVLRLVGSNDQTTFSTISGLVSGTDYTIATAGTTSGLVYRFDASLKHVGRYVRVEVTPNSAVGATAATVVVAARLSQAEKGPVSASDKGVGQAVVRVG